MGLIALMFGWAVGILTRVSDIVIAVLVSVPVGGIILNALKEDCPKGARAGSSPSSRER